MLASKKKKSFLDFFPVPELMRLSNAGIVITDKNVKFFQFRRGVFGRTIPPAYLTVDLPEGTVRAGEIENPEALTNVLRQIATRHDARFVYATLPEEKAYLFTTNIAKVPSSGIRDAVAFIVEENVPVTLSDSVFDFELVKSDSADSLKVTVSVLPKKIVTSYTSALAAAGINPVSFTIESQAIARAIIEHNEARTELIVNLGEDKAGFYIVEDGVVQFSVTPVEEQSASEAMGIEDLKGELKKVLAYWDTQSNKEDHPEKKIERVLFAGARARNKDLVEALVKDIGIEHALADVWVNIPTDHISVAKELYEHSSSYAAAIGLSLPHIK